MYDEVRGVVSADSEYDDLVQWHFFFVISKILFYYR